jgi:membrane associated rhomboid family serine protease
MIRVTWMEKERSLALDICRRCEFVWFDPNEYESLSPALPPKRALGDIDESQLPQAVREALAMDRVRQLREEAAEQGPDNDWQTIPALFGLPVEVNVDLDSRNPIATYIAAALIAFATLWEFLCIYVYKQPVIEWFGLIPAKWDRYDGATIMTSFFLHGGIFHLVSNIYFLVIFGRHVEHYLGAVRWLILLAAAAVVGDVVDIIFMSDSMMPTIGASGGISGLLAFYALQFPHARLGLMFRIGFFFRWVTIPAWGAFGIWILLQFLGAWAQLKHFGNVASLAHLGGALVGVAGWLLWRNLDSKPAPGSSESFPAVTVR